MKPRPEWEADGPDAESYSWGSTFGIGGTSGGRSLRPRRSSTGGVDEDDGVGASPSDLPSTSAFT